MATFSSSRYASSMTDLPDVKPLVTKYPPSKVVTDRLTAEDMRSLLAGLLPGRYTTRMLFPRYRVWAKSLGRPEVHPRAFGKYMRAFVGPDNVEHLSGIDKRIFCLLPEHVGATSSP